MIKYKCILWDWNGTLLDDLDVCLNVMNVVLAGRDLPVLDAERYKDIFCFPVREYYDQLGFDFEIEPFEKISSEFVAEYQQKSFSAKLFEDCKQILELNRRQGIKQVILSASQLEKLEEQVRHFEINEYFDRLLGLDHIHATSKVEIGREWLKESGYKSGEVILIGDTIHDYEVAREIGCDCLLLANGHQSKERVSTLGVPVIESLMEVKDYLF